MLGSLLWQQRRGHRRTQRRENKTWHNTKYNANQKAISLVAPSAYIHRDEMPMRELLVKLLCIVAIDRYYKLSIGNFPVFFCRICPSNLTSFNSKSIFYWMELNSARSSMTADLRMSLAETLDGDGEASFGGEALWDESLGGKALEVEAVEEML